MDNSGEKTIQQVGTEIYVQLLETLTTELFLHPEISNLKKALLATTVVGHLFFSLYKKAGIPKKVVKNIVLNMLKSEYKQ